MEVLLKYGVDLNAVDDEGKTPIDYIPKQDSIDVGCCRATARKGKRSTHCMSINNLERSGLLGAGRPKRHQSGKLLL